MKTSIFRIVCVAFTVLMMSAIVVKAQKPCYDTKWNEGGRVVSKTMYAPGDFGFYEPKWVVNYIYGETGDFLKKEVSVWQPKYELNEKTGRWTPDYGEENWTPKYCYIQKRDSANSFVTEEFFVWNKKEKAYGNPVETMTFRLKDSNHFDYLAFQKGNEYVELVNSINFDKDILAGLSNKVSRIDIDNRLNNTVSGIIPGEKK